MRPFIFNEGCLKMAKWTDDKQSISFTKDDKLEEYINKLLSSKEKVSRAIWCLGIVGMVCLIVSIAVAKISSDQSVGENVPAEITLLIFVLSAYMAILLCLVSWSLSRKIEKANELRIRKTEEKISRYYRQMTKRAGMPDYPLNCDYLNLWTDEDVLYIVEDEQAHLNRYFFTETKPLPIHVKKIPFNTIQCYTKEGDVQYTTHVSGGGGGGSSLSGAVIGGVIAGDAGAIIGSRKKVAPITTETRTYDSRQTVLRYYDDLGRLAVMTFKGFSAYDFLLSVIPDKDLTTIQLEGNNGLRRRSDNINSGIPSLGSGDAKSKLMKLQALYLDDQLTLDEYKEQRARMLNEQ